MLKIVLAKILNDLPFLILTINLSLYSCTMRVFCVTENKPIYLVLENVGISHFETGNVYIRHHYFSV